MKSLRRLACPSRFDTGEHIIDPRPARARLIMASVLAALLTLTFPQPAAAAPGDPDLTFHGQGWTTVPVDISSGFSFAIQDDGRMVAVGSGGPSRGDRLALTRVLPDGTPDLAYFPVSTSEPGRFRACLHCSGEQKSIEIRQQ